MKLPLWVARWSFRLNRMRALPRANRYFSEASPDLRVDTPLFGYTLPLRVSRSPVHRLLSLQLERFLEERSLLASLAGSGETVIDVGANIGYYLLLFLHCVGERGTVICIEPEPANLSELEACIERNRLGNVRLVAAAAGDVPGEVWLEAGLNGRVSSSGGAFRVPQVPVDQFREERPALVKIDVEGYEGQVLAGMQQMMATVRPNLFVEVHPQLLPPDTSPARLLAQVSPHYSRVEFWQSSRPRSLAGKLVKAYFPGRQICRIRQAADAPPARSEPYWMICRR